MTIPKEPAQGIRPIQGFPPLADTGKETAVRIT